MHAIWNHVNLGNLRIIAAGQSTVVLTDGVYAIKIGLIDHKQPKMIAYAHMHGFSVPMIAYERYVTIPQFIQKMIEKTDFYQNAELYTDQDYKLVSFIQNNCADVMIVGLADPYMDHAKEYTESEIENAYAVANNVKDNYETLTRGKWMDVHPWNLARYNGSIVIIDF